MEAQMTKRRTTLRDVAKEAGVSLGSASAALNGLPGVSEETRQRVKEAARRLNYKLAHTSQGRARMLAFICFRKNDWPTPEDMFLSPIIMAMAEATRRHKHVFQFHIFDAMPRHERQQAIAEFAREGLCDGYVLFVFSELNEIDVVELNEIGLPYVILGESPKLIEADCVYVDNRRGGYDATDYLIRNGRRRLAFLSGPPDSLDSLNRFRGYREALAAHGIDFDSRLFEVGNYSVEEGYRAMQSILARVDSPPDGIFCADDRIGQGAVKALKDHGLRVPEDVSVIGFDDSIAAICSVPPLTTMRQPLDSLGASAINLLAERLKDPMGEKKRIVLTPELIVRESCVIRSREDQSIPS